MVANDVLRQHVIGVLCGGLSGEREVSLRSGANVFAALTRRGYTAVQIDVGRDAAAQIHKAGITLAYIALHGAYGEDGCIQGLLEIMGIPYSGSGVLASALGMNKIATKRLLQSAGIATPPFYAIDTATAEVVRDCAAELGFPLVVKPASEGSSINVTIVHDTETLMHDIDAVCSQYGNALVEKFIAGDEVTTGVLGYDDCTEVLPVLGLIPENEFYDYEAKYTRGMTRFVLPAELEHETYASVQATAGLVHRTLGCHGVSRVDSIVDQDGNAWVIEINTAPGMTETSDLPAQAAEYGIDFEELVERILLYALEKK